MHPAPMDRTRWRVLQLLKAAIERSGDRPTTLAKRAGMAPTNITRFLDKPETAPIPSTPTLVKIMETAGMADFPLRERDSRLDAVQVVGEVAAGEWVDAIEWPPADRFEVQVPIDPAFSTVRRFGLRVKGTSMNREYPEKSVVICVDFRELDERPKTGDHVVVYTHRPDGLIEATVKEFQEDERGQFWLWPRSDDPLYQAPTQIPPDGKAANGTRIEIVALVIGSYRKRPPRR